MNVLALEMSTSFIEQIFRELFAVLALNCSTVFLIGLKVLRINSRGPTQFHQWEGSTRERWEDSDSYIMGWAAVQFKRLCVSVYLF